jgi:protein-S-isoprenylcysteine O-methyltransferase Ste14
VPSKLGRATVLRNLVLLALVAVGWPATAAPSLPDLAIAAGLLLAVLAVSRLVAAAASLRRLSPGTEPWHAA